MAEIRYTDEYGHRYAILSGAIATDPEFRYVGADHRTRTNFTLRTGFHLDENGKSTGTFVRCVCWRRMAKLVRHFMKNDVVVVTGEFFTTQYNGNDYEQFRVDTFMPQVYRYRQYVNQRRGEEYDFREDEYTSTSEMKNGKKDNYDF